MKELNDSNMNSNFFFALLLGSEYEIERRYDYGGMNEGKKSWAKYGMNLVSGIRKYGIEYGTYNGTWFLNDCLVTSTKISLNNVGTKKSS